MTVEELRNFVVYDPKTGVFRTRVRLGNKKPGVEIGSLHSAGYLEARINNNRVFLHRMAWLYTFGEMPDGQIDHINGKRDDNSIDNLRVVTQQQNSANMKRRPNNKSGLKGVHKFRKKWVANIHVDGKTRYLGIFSTKEEAHAAYVKAAHNFFGDYARSA